MEGAAAQRGRMGEDVDVVGATRHQLFQAVLVEACLADAAVCGDVGSRWKGERPGRSSGSAKASCTDLVAMVLTVTGRRGRSGPWRSGSSAARAATAGQPLKDLGRCRRAEVRGPESR